MCMHLHKIDVNGKVFVKCLFVLFHKTVKYAQHQYKIRFQIPDSQIIGKLLTPCLCSTKVWFTSYFHRKATERVHVFHSFVSTKTLQGLDQSKVTLPLHGCTVKLSQRLVFNILYYHLNVIKYNICAIQHILRFPWWLEGVSEQVWTNAFVLNCT